MVRRRSSIKFIPIRQFNFNTIKINLNIRKFLKTKKLTINRKRLFVVKRRINLALPFFTLFICSRRVRNLRNLINFFYFAELQPVSVILLNFYLLAKSSLLLKTQFAYSTSLSGLRTITTTAKSYLYCATPRTLLNGEGGCDLINTNIRHTLLAVHGVNIINDFGQTLPEKLKFAAYYLLSLQATHTYYLPEYGKYRQLSYLLTQIFNILHSRQLLGLKEIITS